MRLDVTQRLVSLSVGELAAFRLGPAGPRGAGVWRMALGSAWHQTCQARATAAAKREARPAPQFEVGIKGTLQAGAWQVQLDGRIDQVESHDDFSLLREVKTVRHPLPAEPEDLAAAFPAHFTQLALYHRLARRHAAWAERKIAGELLLVDINEGVSQAVAIAEDEADFRVDEALARLGQFLHQRESARRRLTDFAVAPAFTTLRDGQAATRAQLARHLGVNRHTVLIAPTGFGKTGLVLERALATLREGLCDRIIYATGRSTGQIPVCAQLAAQLDGAGPRWLQLRSRQELNGPLPWPEEARREAPARWRDANPELDALFADGTVRAESIQQLATQWEIEPFEIARALLPFAEIWVADLNYVFSLRHAGVFDGVPGFDPARTLLIVDEAHHLPTRVADGWSHEATAEDFQAVATEAQVRRLPEALWRAVDQLATLAARPAAERLPPAEEDVLAAALPALATALQEAVPRPDEVSEWTLDRLWEWTDWTKTWESRLPLLAWRPRPGVLRLDCLDAGTEIGTTLARFGCTLRMSATFPPVTDYARACGEEPDAAQWILGEAPWREAAFDVAIDTRLDTRFRARPQSIPRSAEAIAELGERADTPIAVFFSSYPYAQAVAEALAPRAPLMRLAVQPRGLDFAAQRAWITTALDQADALFLILGGSFSEGIDALGGRVAWAVVVGPALPEVNGVQKARLEALEASGGSREEAFRVVYQIPGLIKVNQALGRLVRAPGHRARVILQGQRFAQASYHALLDPALGEPAIIRTSNAWQTWLNR